MWKELPNKAREKIRKEKKKSFPDFKKCNAIENTEIFLQFPPAQENLNVWVIHRAFLDTPTLNYTSLGLVKRMTGHALWYGLCLSLPRAQLSTHLGLFNNWLETSPSDFQLNTGHRKTNSTCFSPSLVSRPNCSADQRAACGLVAKAQNTWTFLPAPPPSLSKRNKPDFGDFSFFTHSSPILRNRKLGFKY